MIVKIIASGSRLVFGMSLLLAVASATPAFAQDVAETGQTEESASAVSAAVASEPEMAEEEAQQAEARRRAAAEVAAKLVSEELAARKRVRAFEVSEKARQREALERQCVIRPVMSDEEIDKCKAVWR
ncbi:exported protein of unknown function [Sterolibacterium denitrificans]|uniref:Uncharacterized protein n=1 Tax=Sterolibacterium denitrificans TaxID=157592 RepID=A0A7Z7MVD1_9PROT|nr:hypothetical protein [Sterolibacterium denitrificans]SMB26992.1 exported protein of unknown function [Sterolibacterium denitrificans]